MTATLLSAGQCLDCGGSKPKGHGRCYCEPCLAARKAAGRPLVPKPAACTSVEVRFWRHVTPTDDGSCWIWQGKPNSAGYGKMGGHDGRRGVMLYAHRVSYEMHVGPISDGLHIDHLCRVRMCVNPDHLEAVTPAVNIQRAAPFRPKVTRRRSHCPRGHSLDDAYIVNRANGALQRLCRICLASRRGCRSGHLYPDGAVRDRRGRRICQQCADERKKAS